MRMHWCVAAFVACNLAGAQSITAAYNRDTHEPLHLKRMQVDSTVVGPMVRTDTWLTFANPFKSRIEAAMNFDLPIVSALGGFAYFYGHEYVPSKLIDKNKAWAIYTEITGRGRDPGIMDQMSPSAFHCQIFPVEPGDDLRVRLWSVSLVETTGGEMVLPRPSFLGQLVSGKNWRIHVREGAQVLPEGRVAEQPQPVAAVAQSFEDGKTYVAGIVRIPERRTPSIEILHAYYEPLNGPGRGAEVTEKVAELVRNGEFNIRGENQIFGDPTPNIFKQLRIEYLLDDIRLTKTMPEHDVVQLLQPIAPKFSGLKDPLTVPLDPQTIAFFGWSADAGRSTVTLDGATMSLRPIDLARGTDTARLWAQQMLGAKSIQGRDAILAFSLQYGVPSETTALLAVPEAEMRAFKIREAERHRAELERQKTQRSWGGSRPQNWNSSGGGDPEIRITFANARTVEAILPDGEVLPLKAVGNTWGGNFEIPAGAREGTYTVRVIAHLLNGTTEERAWTYDVDRTPPQGKVSLLNGILAVDSEPGLAQVIAYAPDGGSRPLVEIAPGHYEASLPGVSSLKIMLKDRAGNKTILSWERSIIADARAKNK